MNAISKIGNANPIKHFASIVAPIAPRTMQRVVQPVSVHRSTLFKDWPGYDYFRAIRLAVAP